MEEPNLLSNSNIIIDKVITEKMVTDTSLDEQNNNPPQVPSVVGPTGEELVTTTPDDNAHVLGRNLLSLGGGQETRKSGNSEAAQDNRPKFGHSLTEEVKEDNRLEEVQGHSQDQEEKPDNRIVLRSNQERIQESGRKHSLHEGHIGIHRVDNEEAPLTTGQVRIHEIEDDEDDDDDDLFGDGGSRTSLQEATENHPLMGQVRTHEVRDRGQNHPNVGSHTSNFREMKEENRSHGGSPKKFHDLNDDNRLLVGNQKRIQELSDEHRLLVGNKKRTHEQNEESRPLLNNSSHKKIVVVPSSGGMSNGRATNRPTRLDDGNRPHFINHHARHGGVDGLMRSRQQLPMAMSSLRSLKSVMLEDGGHHSQMLGTAPHTPWRDSYFSDAVSVRSLASLGMGSTDGRRVTIRRVPTSPSELFNIVHPITPTEDGMSMASSSIFDPVEGHTNYRLPRRHQWANKMQFVLACVGYSVGLGNLWRFPYLCFKSGGGVFLVPYFIIFITCGIPLLYMELAIGQFTRRGPIGALGKLCPLFKGAGLASVVISFIMSTYYNVIIAYTLYYLFSAFRSNVPWNSCDNRWNTKNCWNPDRSPLNETRPNMSRTPSEEFYENKVLNMSDGIEHPGQIRWELAACLIFAWVLVYFSIWKSVKSSGKVLYFTATFPYLLILVFLVRALTLDGADLGLRYFFKPCWELLGDAKVWVNAAAQNFNSIGIAYGSVISFASYNRYHNSILSDALAVSCINAVTSVLVGICTFATIGNIAREQGRLIEDVISDGPGLVFVVYPQALSKMPAAQLWGGMFFFMLLCLGLNSQFAIVEVVVTSIQDGFPNWIKRRLLCHEVLVLVVVVVSCLFGIPNITQGGIYFFQLVDHYAASLSIMYLAFFEVIAIAWIYGANRLAKNVQEMTGKYPSVYFSFCWWFAAPVLIMAVWVFSLIDYERPTYDNGTYTYPVWAEALGWFIASLSLACIPVMAVAVIIRAEGDTLLEKFRNSYKSQLVDCDRCGDHKCLHSCTSKEELREMSILLTQKMESQLEQINSP